jgi:DNA repair exonuclease SbcCD ATPase subunit
MSERRRADTAEPSAQDLQAQVDAVADVLYGLTPDDFSPTRDEYIRQARELAKLRKPTQSAWLVNQLWRDQHDVMEQLFELANELSRAQAQSSGSALRELTQQRRQLENALLQQAIGLARQKGVHVSDSVTREAQETLGAALALPEVADEVRSGHLVKPASYAGFGGAAGGTHTSAQPRREPIDLAAIQRARAARTQERPTAAPERADDRRAEAEEAARQAREEEERRRAAAERRLQDARDALSAAEGAAARSERALATAEQRQRDLGQQAETLREQLRRVEASVEEAERETAEARRAQRRAEAERADAADAVAEAERALRQ